MSEFLYGDIPILINNNQLELNIGCLDLVLEKVDSVSNVSGCMDSSYLNYNPIANINDNSCHNNCCDEGCE